VALKLRRTSASTRLKLFAVITIAIATITIPVTASYHETSQASYYPTSQAVSTATAAGPLSIDWGDPYMTPETAQGTGWETLTITGRISQQPNLPGYYKYNTIILIGGLHTEWSDPLSTYALDVSFSLTSYETLYQKVTLNPSADSFYVSSMGYSATLVVTGHPTFFSGQAAVKAAVPGYFEQHGRSGVTTLIIYAPSLGDSQFVVRWSQTSQTVDGEPLPAATQFSQTITTTS